MEFSSRRGKNWRKKNPKNKLKEQFFDRYAEPPGYCFVWQDNRKFIVYTNFDTLPFPALAPSRSFFRGVPLLIARITSSANNNSALKHFPNETKTFLSSESMSWNTLNV
jgi:hypothetical protein